MEVVQICLTGIDKVLCHRNVNVAVTFNLQYAAIMHDKGCYQSQLKQL